MVAEDGAGLMIAKIKAVAAIVIAIAAIVASNTAHADDRIPDELLGCWKYVESGGPVKNPDSIYRRVNSKDCEKGNTLISSNEMLVTSDPKAEFNITFKCRLLIVVSSDKKTRSVSVPVRV